MTQPIHRPRRALGRSSLVLVALGLLLALAGCEEEPIQVGRRAPSRSAGGGPGQSAQQQQQADAGVDAGPQIPEYRDEDFVESEINRDPFHNYAHLFRASPEVEQGGGREVQMSDTSIDEMRVIGIVTGMPSPRAMILDRAGVGHVVRRGDYLGRAEVVQTGGSEELPVTLNWRVDRIRPGEVVLTREDPTAPNRPPLTRVMLLRDEEQERSLPGVRVTEQD